MDPGGKKERERETRGWVRLLLELFRLHLGQLELLLPLRGIRVDQDARGVQEQVLPLQEEAPPGPVGPEAPSVLREAEEGVRVGQ